MFLCNLSACPDVTVVGALDWEHVLTVTLSFHRRLLSGGARLAGKTFGADNPSKWVSWTLSQLCHLVSMWTHCLRHQLVASTFAVSARVRRTFLPPSCSRALCDSTSGLFNRQCSFWLCSDAFIKRPTATPHSAFILKFC